MRISRSTSLVELRALTHVHPPDKGHVLIRNFVLSIKKVEKQKDDHQQIHTADFHKATKRPCSAGT